MPRIVDAQMREATRRRILREAAREFARLGFDQANINLIAEQAGIGKGTIYLYFTNKHELFQEMLRSIAQTHLAAIRTALAPHGTLQERLERLFRAFAQLAEEDSDSFHVSMSALYGVNRAFQEEATRLLREYLAVIALVLEEGRARGEIQLTDVEATALQVLSLTESYVLSARVLGWPEATIRSKATLLARQIIKGIASTSV
ncbi:MAG TPA: TetR/AcrR family transcriptional regulator [Ktedonobacteraceae bacterium]|nr:TetR/AcrR family transcriptional regulator [Ktedonobacteraceae bacterium]